MQTYGNSPSEFNTDLSRFGGRSACHTWTRSKADSSAVVGVSSEPEKQLWRGSAALCGGGAAREGKQQAAELLVAHGKEQVGRVVGCTRPAVDVGALLLGHGGHWW